MTERALRHWLVAVGAFVVGFATCGVLFIGLATFEKRPSDVYKVVRVNALRLDALLDVLGVADPAEDLDDETERDE